MRFIVLGAPGAGKGTQAKLLAQRAGVTHISSGDLFRHHQQEGTALGLQVIEYLDQGLLVPDQITINVVLEEVLSPRCQKGFVLDGFPRNLNQAGALDMALERERMRIDKAILIDVSAEELISRLGKRQTCQQCGSTYHPEGNPAKEPGVCDQCGGALYRRPDDEPQAISNRLRVYWETMAPLIDYYRSRCNLVTVDGVGSLHAVHRRIEMALGWTR